MGIARQGWLSTLVNRQVPAGDPGIEADDRHRPGYRGRRLANGPAIGLD